MTSVDQLFEIKQKFLREVPHPKLITAQLKRLGVSDVVSHDKIKLSQQSLPHYLEKYLNDLMPLKLKISNANSKEELAELLLQLLHKQTRLIRVLASFYPDEVKMNDADVKQSERMDVYAVLKELQEHQLESENEINTYLCKRLETAEKNDLSGLTRLVVQAKKIVNHGG